MKILVIDNYDSFTYNLVHSIKKVCLNVTIARNDEITLDEIKKFDKILLSPGPGIPSESNLLIPIIHEFSESKPIFGVCLGMQAIGEVFGGRLLNTQKVYHGIASKITITQPEDYLFNGIEQQPVVGRYHSWVVDQLAFPFDKLDITSVGPNNEIMSIRHKYYDVSGVQFHPESILTPSGDKIIENWVKH